MAESDVFLLTMHLSGGLNNDPVIPLLPSVLKMFLSTVALYLYSVFVQEDCPKLGNKAEGIWHAPFNVILEHFVTYSPKGHLTHWRKVTLFGLLFII